jgi:hypothetical protein
MLTHRNGKPPPDRDGETRRSLTSLVGHGFHGVRIVLGLDGLGSALISQKETMYHG